MAGMATITEVNRPVSELAALLIELNDVVARHGAHGFSLMFAPQSIRLPEGYVLVQQINQANGTIELVPTPIDELQPDGVLHDTQVLSLDDVAFIAHAAGPNLTRGCTVGRDSNGRVHTYGKWS